MGKNYEMAVRPIRRCLVSDTDSLSGLHHAKNKGLTKRLIGTDSDDSVTIDMDVPKVLGK